MTTVYGRWGHPFQHLGNSRDVGHGWGGPSLPGPMTPTKSPTRDVPTCRPVCDAADALLVAEQTKILSEDEVELAGLIREALARERAEILPENRHLISG